MQIWGCIQIALEPDRWQADALDALAGRCVNGRVSPCSSSASSMRQAITRDSNADYKLSRRYGASANLCRITND
jgi:hypothetical protein